MALNDRKRRFVKEYLIDLNATQAAIRAGYSEKTAYSQGQRLLKDVEINGLIQKEQQKRAETLDITKDRIVEELAKIEISRLKLTQGAHAPVEQSGPAACWPGRETHARSDHRPRPCRCH